MHEQVEILNIISIEDWTHVCGKRRGWLVHRGERLIKLGDSWFSAKSIDVKPFKKVLWCRALNGYGERTLY